MSASFVAFERCLEVTDYKKFDTGNMPSSWNFFLHFLKIIKLQRFSESSKICVIDLTGKISPKFMSANAYIVRFKLACNVHVWAYFEKLAFSGKT